MRKVKSLTKNKSISSPKKKVQSLSYYKQKSPLSSPIFTPHINFSKIYSPNWQQTETIQDKMKDPKWIPFWRKPKDLEKRKKSWLPTHIYDKYYETHKEPFSSKSTYYYAIATGLIDYLVDTKYQNVEKYEAYYRIDLQNNYFSFLKERGQKTLHDIIKNSCLNPIKDITLIHMGYIYKLSDGQEGAHSQILIINHIYKTIEFYDPTYLENMASAILEIKILELIITNNIKYTYKNLNDTCPKLNFQNFENLGFIPQPLRADGFCLLWSTFLAQIRITYARYSTQTVKRMITRLVREMKEHLEFCEDKSINPFAKFIYNYSLYWEKKMPRSHKLKGVKKLFKERKAFMYNKIEEYGATSFSLN